MKKSVLIPAAVALVLVIAAVAGYMVLIRPKQADARKIDDQIAALQVQLDAATKLSGSQGAGTPNPAPGIRVADVVKLAKAMPDDVDMAGIILELNSAATAAGVEFSAIEPAAPQPGNGYTVIPINLTFDGTYYELTQLLFSLRNLVTVRDGVLDAHGRLLTIDAVDLAEGPNSFPQLQASLVVSAYQYGVDPAVAAGATGTQPAQAASGATTTTTTTTTTGTTPATTEAPPQTTTQAPSQTTTTPTAGQAGDGAQQAQGVTP